MPRTLLLTALACLAWSAVATGAPERSRTWTVPQVKQAFRAKNGVALTTFSAASTRDVTSLRTRPHRTARFGDFQLFVFRPAVTARMRRIFTGGARPDRQRIYWVSDQAGGEIAVTLHARNLAVGWFPPSGAHLVDARWYRLQAAVRKAF